MYPPILVLVLALVTFSKQTLSLETLLQLDSLDDGDVDVAAGGGGGDISSPLYEDENYGPDPEEDHNLNNYQQPAILLDDVYYRVTPDLGDESENDKTSVSTSSSTTTTHSIPHESSEEQLSPTDRSASTAGSNTSEDHITDSEGQVSVAQPFISDELQEPSSNRSRSLDHDTADSLQSSTVLETSLASNFLYTSSHYNESYHHHPDSTDDSSSERTSDDPLDSVEDDPQLLATTTAVSPLAIPDDVSPVITPTKPHFDESKISKSELLARMIADKNLRLPIAILMDTCNESLSYSKKVFDASLVPRSPLEVILMRYNSTGIAKSTSFRNTRSLMDAINSLQPSYENSGRAYYGILRTSQEIPYDSAIFLATSNTATDKELSRMAALTLLKKRIRLYVIWFGDEVDTTLSDQHLDSQTGLHELAYKTGGRVIRFEIDRHFGNNPVLTTLVSESDLHGHQSIPIPVEEDVNSLYFKLHGVLDTATLRTPNGYIIDLLHNTVSQDLSGTDPLPTKPSPIPKPSIITTNNSTNVHHDHNNPSSPSIQDYLFIVSRVNTSTAGVYYLNVSAKDAPAPSTQLLSSEQDSNTAGSNSSFSVIVKADYDMRHGIEFLELGDPEMERRYDDPSNDVDFVPPSATGGSNTNAEGRHSLSARKQTRQTESQILAESEESGFIGRATAIQSVTKIDLGLNSQLTGTRGTTISLIFEVTNFRQTPVFYYFRVTDELGFLRSLNPGSATIGPLQTLNVAVTLIIGLNVEIGTRDKITFSTEGPDRISHAAWVTVTEASGIPDAYIPSVWYTYTSRCEGRNDPGRCAGAFWTVDITARDYETGLLKIASNPPGLIYRTPFTAGTKDEVKGTYTASCCQPMVTISAYDITRNVRTINLDVRDIWLNEAGIAAVVLGVLLLIALIILLVLLCRYCIRKRRSKELPIYRGELRDRRT